MGDGLSFKKWMNKSMSVPQTGWHHGTQSGDALRTTPIQVSNSGGGQRGLKGFWLTRDLEYAGVYSKVLSEKPGIPEVISFVLSPNLKIANLVGTTFEEMWNFVGIDLENNEQTAKLREMQPFAMTKLLVQQGYDGAMISNTVKSGGSDELVIFDPKNVSIQNKQNNPRHIP